MAEQELGLGAQCGHDGVLPMPDAGGDVSTGPLPQSGDIGQQAIDAVMAGPPPHP